jgi:hypothetical protein
LTTGKKLAKATKLVERVRPILAGRSPEVIGAALAELAATFIANHAPPLRADQQRLFFDLVQELVPVVVEEGIAMGRYPPEWRTCK